MIKCEWVCVVGQHDFYKREDKKKKQTNHNEKVNAQILRD